MASLDGATIVCVVSATISPKTRSICGSTDEIVAILTTCSVFTVVWNSVSDMCLIYTKHTYTLQLDIHAQSRYFFISFSLCSAQSPLSSSGCRLFGICMLVFTSSPLFGALVCLLFLVQFRIAANSPNERERERERAGSQNRQNGKIPMLTTWWERQRDAHTDTYPPAPRKSAKNTFFSVLLSNGDRSTQSNNVCQ